MNLTPDHIKMWREIYILALGKNSHSGNARDCADRAVEDYDDFILSNRDQEQELQKNNKAVKDAWEKYQVLLKLHSTTESE